MITIPRRKPGRPSPAASALYALEVQAFCEAMQELRSGLEFPPSARGWCYVLEEHGLDKGDFDSGERLINDCRKSGDLPLDICGVDDKRSYENTERIFRNGVKAEAQHIVDVIRWMPDRYTPTSFWDEQDVYVQMLAEKIDIKRLFAPVCAEFHVPIGNAGGWSDLNGRADMMRRFMEWEERGKRCVLLYIGDHDPGGLQISSFLGSNLADLSAAVGWSPDSLIIERFGLDYDFIEANGLTWIDGLSTGNPKTPNLEDPRHPDHLREYVQDYLRRFGARKVESNALMAPSRIDAGKELCRQAILKYVREDAPGEYLERLRPLRAQVRTEVLRLLAEEFGGAP